MNDAKKKSRFELSRETVKHMNVQTRIKTGQNCGGGCRMPSATGSDTGTTAMSVGVKY